MDAETIVNEKFSRYWNAVKDDPSDFTSWTCLLQTVDQENLLEQGREAYEEFFKFYPYCYGYWKKYADLEKKNDNNELAKQVFEAGVQAVPLSVDLWIHYLNFMSQIVKDEENGHETMRRLFREAIDAAGAEFRSDKLYDTFIDWEKSQKNLQNVTKIYDQLLATPTQQYAKHFNKFKEHVNANKPSEILSSEEYLMMLGEVESIPPGASSSDDVLPNVVTTTAPPGEDDGIDTVINAANDTSDARVENEDQVNQVHNEADGSENETSQETKSTQEDAEIKLKIIAAREIVFKKNEEEVKKRWSFEDGIKRPYFHVKPLERSQLKNWREYLDFEMNEGNNHRIGILFERCLIACALYEEFWQKYISYLESRVKEENGIEVTRHAYERGCTIHLRKKPNIHLNWAAFEEGNKNTDKARSILQSLDETVPGMIMVKLRLAGLERRNGNLSKAVEIFQEEIEKTVSVDEKSFFAIKCSKFFTRYLKDRNAAKQIIHKALENDKGNKQLYLHLLDLELSADELDEKHLDDLCNQVDNCEELSSEFKQGFHQRRIEVLEDFGQNINEIVMAYDNYQSKYKIKPAGPLSRKRSRGESDAGDNVKFNRTDPYSTQNDTTVGIPAYSNTSYAPNTSIPAAAAVTAPNAYGYNQTMANQWGAYAAHGAGAYYGWYNPYGAYPQQPTQ